MLSHLFKKVVTSKTCIFDIALLIQVEMLRLFLRYLWLVKGYIYDASAHSDDGSLHHNMEKRIFEHLDSS